MNKNIDLTKILANAPKGLKLYTPICGTVLFEKAKKECDEDNFPIVCYSFDINRSFSFTKDGKYYKYKEGECLLFPSKNQRDWSEFGKYKKPLMPFQKVLVREGKRDRWRCDFYSHYEKSVNKHYCTSSFTYDSSNILPYEGNEYRLGTVTE